jgi:aminoglycoside phosphotransferase
VNANLDTMREIGWLLDEPDASSIIGNDPKKAKALGMIVARDFNTIQIIGDKVIKSSKSDNILGELYFYAHLPVQLLPIFPSIYSVDYIKETSNYTITMENRKGLTFSHLLVGRSITKGRLLSLLRALHTIHTTQNPIIRRLDITPDLDAKFDEHSLERAGGRVNIYANYAHKLRTRYRVHAKTYADLGPLSSELFNRLNEFLDTYEAEDKGVHAQIIHGDPVFSNAILSKDERKVSFIDVRCQLNNTLTMEGDIHYDLAKVLQSLVGYDHVLYRVEQQHANLQAPDTPLLEEPDQNMLADLQEVFWDFLNTEYAVTIHRKTLLRITASLFFSLIPLHRPALSGIFLRMCKDTLDKAQEIGHRMGDSMLMGKLSLNEVSRPSTANSLRPGDLTEHSLMKTGGGILA